MTKFESFYELLHGSESINHNSHFIDNCSGDQVGDWWTRVDAQGTGTATANDAIDGGILITTGATSADHTAIAFNDIRQYDWLNSIVIFNMNPTTADWSFGGFTNVANTDLSASTTSNIVVDTSHVAFYSLRSGDGTTNSITSSTYTSVAELHNHKIELLTSSSEYKVDDTLLVTKTTNLPIAKLQPIFGERISGAGAESNIITYVEAYNK